MQFLIVTPRVTPSSNGIRCLHKLSHTFNRLGVRAELAIMESDDPRCQRIRAGSERDLFPEYPSPLASPIRILNPREFIVMYPETIIGNPIGAAMVARYLGNKEGFCNRGSYIQAGPRDFLIAHSRVISSVANHVLFNADFHPAMNANGTLPFHRRTTDASYIGKGWLYGETRWFDGTVHIERTQPATKDALALVLRNTRRYITWDSWSATNVDAILCGAMLVIARMMPWTAAELDASELGPVPRVEMASPTAALPEVSEAICAEHYRVTEGVRQRIAEYGATWDTRVAELLARVGEHFA